MVTIWISNRMSWEADRSVSVPITFSDLDRWEVTGQIYWWISVITLLLFDLE